MTGACGEAVGTDRGAMRHYRADEDPCEPCRIARNLASAQRKRRRAFPAIVMERARARAIEILIARYPIEFYKILNEEFRRRADGAP